MFETRLYIQFSGTRLKVSSPQTVHFYECTPFVAIENKKGKKFISAIGKDAEDHIGKPNFNVVNPFAHSRMVIGDFTVAEKLLQHGLHMFLKGKWLLPRLAAIIHPERQLEGGLTQIEFRAVREAGENAGCRRVVIYEGRALTMEEVRSYEMFS